MFFKCSRFKPQPQDKDPLQTIDWTTKISITSNGLELVTSGIVVTHFGGGTEIWIFDYNVTTKTYKNEF